MGEVKRRRRLERFARGVQAEGQGVWRIELINRQGVLELLPHAQAGDTRAQRLLLLVRQLLDQVAACTSPDPEAGTLCLLCDTVFWQQQPPEVWSILLAERDDPHRVLATGICTGCCTRLGDLSAIKDAVLAYYQDKMIPDLRVLPSFSAPGRA